MSSLRHCLPHSHSLSHQVDRQKFRSSLTLCLSVSLSPCLSVSPSLLPFWLSPLVESQLCFFFFAVGQPSANTPASNCERSDDSPCACHRGRAHTPIHKVGRERRARAVDCARQNCFIRFKCVCHRVVT